MQDSNAGLSIQQRSQGNITNVTFSNIVVETRYNAPRWCFRHTLGSACLPSRLRRSRRPSARCAAASQPAATMGSHAHVTTRVSCLKVGQRGVDFDHLGGARPDRPHRQHQQHLFHQHHGQSRKRRVDQATAVRRRCLGAWMQGRDRAATIARLQCTAARLPTVACAAGERTACMESSSRTST
jgi:hypothetical protein